MRRPLDDILNDLRGATARTMSPPDLKKMRATAAFATEARPRPRLSWAAGAAVLALALGFGGAFLAQRGLPAGQKQAVLAVPRGFWSLAAIQQRPATFSIFPHLPGSRACAIPHGGVSFTPSYTPLQGVCTTEVLTRQGYLERFQHGPVGIWRAVVLSERWKGPASQGRRTAAWVFLLDRQGQLLHIQIVGVPPQDWK